MKFLIPILMICFAGPTFCQTNLELTPAGFATVTIKKPSKNNEKFIEAARSWVISYNTGNEHPFDIYDITENSFRIDAHRVNAFFYRNVGEAYFHRIKYSMEVLVAENSYTIKFAVKEIHTSNVLTEMTVADLFMPDGKLKSDYLVAKSSLEKSVNGIIRSFATYLEQY